MAPHRLWRHLGTYMAPSWHPSVLPWRTVGPLSTLMAHTVQYGVAPWCPFSTLIIHLVVPVALSRHPCVPQGASLASLWAFCPPQWHVHGTLLQFHGSFLVPCARPVYSLGSYMASSCSSITATVAHPSGRSSRPRGIPWHSWHPCALPWRLGGPVRSCKMHLYMCLRRLLPSA